MQHEPMELSMSSATDEQPASSRVRRWRRGRKRRAADKHPPAAEDRSALLVEAIDEAFATLPRRPQDANRQETAPTDATTARQVTPPPSQHFSSQAGAATQPSTMPVGANARRHETNQLAVQLAAQLEELDRQRERLARLVQQIDSRTMADQPS